LIYLTVLIIIKWVRRRRHYKARCSRCHRP